MFSLHRQCVELEGKMATAAGGNLGWETGKGGKGKVSGRAGGENSEQSFFWKVSDDDDEDEDEDEDDDEYDLFGGSGSGNGSAAFGRPSGEGGAEVDDLMAKFQRGGGELDLSQLKGSGSGSDSDSATGGGKTPSSAAAAGGMVEEDTAARGGPGESSIDGRRGASIDSFADEDDDEEEEEEDDEEDEEDDEEREGRREKGGLGDLLWGHEGYESDGFDSSLEEQVETM